MVLHSPHNPEWKWEIKFLLTAAFINMFFLKPTTNFSDFCKTIIMFSQLSTDGKIFCTLYSYGSGLYNCKAERIAR